MIGGDDAPFGFSARDAVAGLPVRDGYPLRHDDGATTMVSVGIESADLDEVLWVKRSYGGREEIRFPSAEALLFRGVVRFRSEDGTYDERLETPIFATATDSFTFEATVPVERIAGTLDTSRSEPKVESVTIGGLVEGDEASGLVSTFGKTGTELVYSHVARLGAAAEF